MQSAACANCRRGSASTRASSGPSCHCASGELGLSTIQITLDRYGHLFPSVEEALAEALDAAFAAEGEQVSKVAQLR